MTRLVNLSFLTELYFPQGMTLQNWLPMPLTFLLNPLHPADILLSPKMVIAGRTSVISGIKRTNSPDIKSALQPASSENNADYQSVIGFPEKQLE